MAEVDRRALSAKSAHGKLQRLIQSLEVTAAVRFRLVGRIVLGVCEVNRDVGIRVSGSYRRATRSGLRFEAKGACGRGAPDSLMALRWRLGGSGGAGNGALPILLGLKEYRAEAVAQAIAVKNGLDLRWAPPNAASRDGMPQVAIRLGAATTLRGVQLEGGRAKRGEELAEVGAMVGPVSLYMIMQSV
ncbi:hypothetical protein ACSSS7_008020 [Eimeria intestinalis]